MCISDFTPLGAATSVSATASSVAGALTWPAGANALHIVNTSATLYVSTAWATSSASATLGSTGVTLPPMGHIVVPLGNSAIASVAAIGSGAGPTPVVFTPGRVG